MDSQSPILQHGDGSAPRLISRAEHEAILEQRMTHVTKILQGKLKAYSQFMGTGKGTLDDLMKRERPAPGSGGPVDTHEIRKMRSVVTDLNEVVEEQRGRVKGLKTMKIPQPPTAPPPTVGPRDERRDKLLGRLNKVEENTTSAMRSLNSITAYITRKQLVLDPETEAMIRNANATLMAVNDHCIEKRVNFEGAVQDNRPSPIVVDTSHPTPPTSSAARARTGTTRTGSNQNGGAQNTHAQKSDANQTSSRSRVVDPRFKNEQQQIGRGRLHNPEHQMRLGGSRAQGKRDPLGNYEPPAPPVEVPRVTQEREPRKWLEGHYFRQQSVHLNEDPDEPVVSIAEQRQHIFKLEQSTRSLQVAIRTVQAVVPNVKLYGHPSTAGLFSAVMDIYGRATRAREELDNDLADRIRRKHEMQMSFRQEYLALKNETASLLSHSMLSQRNAMIQDMVDWLTSRGIRLSDLRKNARSRNRTHSIATTLQSDDNPVLLMREDKAIQSTIELDALGSVVRRLNLIKSRESTFRTTAQRIQKLAEDITSFANTLEMNLQCDDCKQCQLTQAYAVWPCGHVACASCVRARQSEYGEILCHECGVVTQDGAVPNIAVSEIAARCMFKSSGYNDIASAIAFFLHDIDVLQGAELGELGEQVARENRRRRAEERRQQSWRDNVLLKAASVGFLSDSDSGSRGNSPLSDYF